jgi:hypothetical protein
MARRVSVKGKGADLFFGEYSPATSPEPERDAPTPNDASMVSDHSTTAPEHAAATVDPATESVSQAASLVAPPARVQRTKRLNGHASTLASTPSSQLAVSDAGVIETIRKIVKDPGKEVSFVRLSPTEKGHLADIVYTYKRQGVKTSENEINRIAVNYLIDDYRQHGERSILAQVIAALRA